MRNVLALQVIEATGIPEAELQVARGLLERLEGPEPDASAVLETWIAMSLMGMRKDVTEAILDLRLANTMTIRYIKEVVSQADQFQDAPAPAIGDDPHANRSGT